MATLTASNVVSNAADSVLSDYAHYTLQAKERYIDTKKWKISYSTNRGKLDRTGDALGTETIDAADEQSPVTHRLYPLIWYLRHTITAKIECQIGELVKANEITYESVEQRGSTLIGAKALVPYVSDPEHLAAANTCSGQWWLQNRVLVPDQAAQAAWHTMADSLRTEIDDYEASVAEWETAHAAWVTEHEAWETAKKKHDDDPEHYPDPGPEPAEPIKPEWYGLSATNCLAFTNTWNTYGVTELKTYKAADPATATCEVVTTVVSPANVAYWSWYSPTYYNISTAEQLQQAYTALCGEHELFSDVPWQVWEDLISRINDIREWLGIPLKPEIDSEVSEAGDPLLASVYNKAVSAIGYPFWTWRDDPTVEWYTGRLDVRRRDAVYEAHILELAKNLNVLIKLGLEADYCPDLLSNVYAWFDEYGRIVVFDSVLLYTSYDAFTFLLAQLDLEDFESRVLEIEEYISFLYLFYLRDDISDVLRIDQTIHTELWSNFMSHWEEPLIGHPLIQVIYSALFHVFESRVLVLDELFETIFSGILRDPAAQRLSLAADIEELPSGDLLDADSDLLDNTGFTVAANFVVDLWSHWTAEFIVDQIIAIIGDFLLLVDQSILLYVTQSISTIVDAIFRTAASILLDVATEISAVESGEIHIPTATILAISELFNSLPAGNLQDQSSTVLSSQEYQVVTSVIADIWVHWTAELYTDTDIIYALLDALLRTTESQLLSGYSDTAIIEFGNFATQVPFYLTNASVESEVEDMFGNVEFGVPGPIPYSNVITYESLKSKMGFGNPAAIGEVSNVELGIFGRMFLDFLDNQNYLWGYLSTLHDTFGELDYDLSDILDGAISEESLLAALIEFSTTLELGQSSFNTATLIASLLQFTSVFEIPLSSTETATAMSSTLAPTVPTSITSLGLDVCTFTSSWLGFLDDVDFFIGSLFTYSAIQALMQFTVPFEIENGETTIYHDTSGAIEFVGTTLFEGALPATQHMLNALLEWLVPQAIGYGFWSNTANILGIIDFISGWSFGTSNVTEIARLRSLLQFSIPWSMGTADEMWELLTASSLAFASYSEYIGSMESAQSGVASIGLSEYLDTFNSASTAALSYLAMFGPAAFQPFFGQDSFNLTDMAAFGTMTSDLLHANNVMGSMIYLAFCEISDMSSLMSLATFISSYAAIGRFPLAQAIQASSGEAFKARPDLHACTAALLYYLSAYNTTSNAKIRTSFVVRMIAIDAIMRQFSTAYVRPCTPIGTIGKSIIGFSTFSTALFALPVDVDGTATDRLVYRVEELIMKATMALHGAGIGQFLHATWLDMKEITELASTGSITTSSSMELDHEDMGGWRYPIQEDTDLYVRQVWSIVHYSYPNKYTDLSFDVYPLTVMTCNSPGGGTVTAAVDQCNTKELSSGSYAASLVCIVHAMIGDYCALHTNIILVDDLDMDEQESAGWEYPIKAGNILYIPQVREITHFINFAHECELGFDAYKRILMMASNAPATLESTLSSVEHIDLVNTMSIAAPTGVATINSNSASDWEYPVQTVSVLFVPQTAFRRKYDLTKLEVE